MKVSIIITTYKGHDNIANAVESCLNQSYKDIEVIVVDDNGKGSENQVATYKALKNYIDTGKITYIPHDNNSNASVARNTGAEYANGEWLAFLDDDDVFCVDKIKLQVESVCNKNKEVGVIYCSRKNFVGGKPVNIKTARYNGNFTYPYLMARVSACTSTIMIRRDIFWAVNGFDPTYTRHQDWEFMVRLSTITEIKAINYIGTYKYSKNILKRFKAEEAEKYRNYYLEKLKPVITKLNAKQQYDIYAYHYNEIAKLYFREKNYEKMNEYLKKGNRVRWFIMDMISGTVRKTVNLFLLKLNIVPKVKG